MKYDDLRGDLIGALAAAFIIFGCGIFTGVTVSSHDTAPHAQVTSLTDSATLPAAPTADDREICAPHGGWLVCMPQSMLQQKFGADACFNGNGNPVPCGGKDPREEQ